MAIDLTGLGAVSTFLSNIADKVWPDKTAQEVERNKFQLAAMHAMQSGALEELKTSLSAILAEAQSADPWTSRARPTFMYVIYIMILMGIPMGFVAAFRPELAQAVAEGMRAWLAAIPSELYALFGAGYLGYAYTRTKEKVAGVSK